VNLGWEELKKVGSLVGFGGAFTAIVILLGRLWTKSYYGVFGLPTEDIDLGVWDYAFRTKDILVMLILGAVIGGAVALTDGVALRGAEGTGLTRLGKGLVVAGLALLGFVFYLAQYKPAWADFVWGPHGLIGFLGGVGLGLVFGVLVHLMRGGVLLWGAIAGGGALALLTVFLPWLTIELATFRAFRDIRGGFLPQVIVEFQNPAPSAIRRTDDPRRSDVVYLVLATTDRLFVAHPFGCDSVGIQHQIVVASPDVQSDICDIFAFDRDEVESIRMFGKGTRRPFNDEPSNPDVVTLAEDAETNFDRNIELTAARADRCGINDDETDRNLAHGVWFELDAAQSGRVVFYSLSDPFYVTSMPLESGIRCDHITGHADKAWELDVGRKLFVLVSSPAGDRVEKHLKFSFTPLDFRFSDAAIGTTNQTTTTTPLPQFTFTTPTASNALIKTPFLVKSRSRLEVRVTGVGNSVSELASGCTALRSGRVTVATPGSQQLQLCPTTRPKRGVASATFTLPIPIDAGTWELRFNTPPDDLDSYQIHLSPIGAGAKSVAPRK
jgi:hypothetical protein